MPRKTEDEQIAELEARKRVLEMRVRVIQSRQKERRRKEDTRRKILAGAAVLAEAEKNPAAKQKLINLLDQHLARDVDRRVFDLPPKPKIDPTHEPSA